MTNTIMANAESFAAAVLAVKQARRDGTLNWTKIARDYGVSLTTLRRHCDAEFHECDNERRAAAKRERQREKFRHKSFLNVRGKALRREDYMARLAEIPKDDRGLTARIFGDPIFSRSALGRERGAK